MARIQEGKNNLVVGMVEWINLTTTSSALLSTSQDSKLKERRDLIG